MKRNNKEKETISNDISNFACLSNVGTKRNNNEDVAYCCKSPYGYLLTIADGMGGHRKGEIASKIASDTVSLTFSSNRKALNLKSSKKILTDGFKKANKEVYRLSSATQYKEMGTTLISAIVFDQGCYIVSVGDSRLYLLKDKKLKQVSIDQTNIQLYKETGRIKTDEDEKSVRKLLLNAIGINANLDSYEEYYLKNEDFDSLFLCSDGINSVLEDNDIENILNEDISVKDKVVKLIETSLKRNVVDNVATVLWERKI